MSSQAVRRTCTVSPMRKRKLGTPLRENVYVNCVFIKIKNKKIMHIVRHCQVLNVEARIEIGRIFARVCVCIIVVPSSFNLCYVWCSGKCNNFSLINCLYRHYEQYNVENVTNPFFLFLIDSFYISVCILLTCM